MSTDQHDGLSDLDRAAMRRAARASSAMLEDLPFEPSVLADVLIGTSAQVFRVWLGDAAGAVLIRGLVAQAQEHRVWHDEHPDAEQCDLVTAVLAAVREAFGEDTAGEPDGASDADAIALMIIPALHLTTLVPADLDSAMAKVLGLTASPEDTTVDPVTSLPRP